VNCAIYAMSAVTGIGIPDLIKQIGHDGTEIVFPHLPVPMRYKGFPTPELIDCALKLGWAMTPIDAAPQYSPNGIDVKDCSADIEYYLANFDGMAFSKRPNAYHFTAKINGMWFGPEPENIITFWVFNKLNSK
jgi:hypothetical protein